MAVISRRSSCAEEGPNGYSELWVSPGDPDGASSRRSQKSELVISSPLFMGKANPNPKATPDLSFILGRYTQSALIFKMYLNR